MSERQGIEIDYCPQCRGVWLDRGELDKIIERSSTEMAPPSQPSQPQAPVQPNYQAPPQPNYPPPTPGYGYRRDDDDDYYKKHGHYHGKRKKSFFEELFD
jgi:hypothetical protein